MTHVASSRSASALLLLSVLRTTFPPFALD